MNKKTLNTYKELMEDQVFTTFVCKKIGKSVKDKYLSHTISDIEKSTILRIKTRVCKHFERLGKRRKITGINWHHMFILLGPQIFDIDFYFSINK